MAKLLLGAGLVLAVFAGLLFLGGGDPPPPDAAAIRRDGHEAPGWAQLLGRVTAPFAPRLDLPASRFALAEGETRQIAIRPWDGDTPRIGRLVLVQGSALVTWRCNDIRREDCTQELCLAPGPRRPDACAETPLREGSISGDPSGGMLRLRALDGAAVLEQR